MKQNINKPVTITAMGFRKNYVAYPRRMEFDGIAYNFIDAGLSCIIRHGERIAQVLTMTDGNKQFRLRSDNKGGSWTLISMSS